MQFLTLRMKNLQTSKSSSQTGRVDTEIQPWDVLHSRIGEYQLHRFRFSGCFSEVAECKDIQSKEIVAIKILKRRANHSQESNRELAMLKRIRGLDPDNIVQFFEGFEHKGRICLAFEMLDRNLHELLKERRGNLLSLQEIKPITQQLLAALKSLKTVGVIHTNIKPHNIMVVNQKHKPFRVKLTDFGSAIKAAEVKRGVIMQPIGYRSPDVIVGLPISEAVDMWSLGGVLATMYLGSLPFPQRCQYYLMKTIVETLGQPEDELLSDGTNTLLYFSPTKDSTRPAWRLKTADEYKAATGFPPQVHRGSSTRFNCLSDLMMLYPAEDFEDRIMFVSLLGMMLHLNPQKRITPSRALIHPFLTPSELDDGSNANSQEMASDTPMNVPPVVESAEEVNTFSASNHTNEEPIDDGDTAAVETADGASAIGSSTGVASAATETSKEDSAVSCSGVGNLPAVCVSEEASDAVSAVAPVMTGLNDTVSAGGGASESTAASADGPASSDEALARSVKTNDTGPRVEDSAPGCSSVESVRAVHINGRDSDAGGSFDQATDFCAGSANDEAAVTPASTAAFTSTVKASFGPLTVDSTDVNISSGGVSESENTRRTQLKRIRRFFARMSWARCCCCSE